MGVFYCLPFLNKTTFFSTLLDYFSVNVNYVLLLEGFF